MACAVQLRIFGFIGFTICKIYVPWFQQKEHTFKWKMKWFSPAFSCCIVLVVFHCLNFLSRVQYWTLWSLLVVWLSLFINVYVPSTKQKQCNKLLTVSRKIAILNSFEAFLWNGFASFNAIFVDLSKNSCSPVVIEVIFFPSFSYKSCVISKSSKIYWKFNIVKFVSFRYSNQC